jgi:7-cyano-7-deazaguanine synthase
MTPSTIVLLSGGIDSAVLLHHLNQTRKVIPIFFDYGQRAARRESAAAEEQCGALGLPLVSFDLTSAARVFQAAQTAKLHVPLPHRNLVLLSLALAYATQLGAPSVALAIVREDSDWYPSASPSFLNALGGVATVLNAPAVETPFITYSKSFVIREGQRLGVNFSHTYSCMLGHEWHCGRCHQCVSRRQSMNDGGALDPPEFYRTADPEIGSNESGR